jgi:hypothetical protein
MVLVAFLDHLHARRQAIDVLLQTIQIVVHRIDLAGRHVLSG